MALQNYIAEYYAKKGFVFHTVTSAKNFIGAMNRSPKWKLKAWNCQKGGHDRIRKDKVVRDRKIATFEYCGEFAAQPKITVRQKTTMANQKIYNKKKKRK